MRIMPEKSTLLRYGIFVVLALLLVLLAQGSGKVQGTTLTVDDDGNADFISIQDAINASAEGDTIRVWEGIYPENVVVNRTVSLVGNGSTTTLIHGGGSGDVVYITAGWVDLSGFTITGSGNESYNSGIKIRRGDNNHIVRNNCPNNHIGILLVSFSRNNTITNNICSWNGRNGIFLERSYNCTLANNTCSANNQSGIYLLQSWNNMILNNLCFENGEDGILLVSIDTCSISTNTCSKNNGHGIYVQSSDSNRLTNNVFTSNKGYGIYLKYSDDCTIENNEARVKVVTIDDSSDSRGMNTLFCSWLLFTIPTMTFLVVVMMVKKGEQKNAASKVDEQPQQQENLPPPPGQ